MLFNKSFLPLVTPLSLLSLSLISSLGILHSRPTLATEKGIERNQGELLAQTVSRNRLPNGSYLYGSSPQPDEIGQEYMVFQVHQGEVKGAVYMPHSEFSCFTGTFEGNQMRMSVIDPYDGTRYDYSVALQAPSTVASNGQWSDIGLEGYYRLDDMSRNDQKILDTCS
ncbi:hypothetical protein cce_0205 [Crocosphaera subtropica ATCC 51142]|uniref:Uncharacterized protein n=1 Tax=Crocosphaera subtropica (strain ATCC 51142 / BH68) TaxID=43989 RepID=B1X055_CROS5|nr:hypothetical protein [Crocosphaera subtropica]ACB49556.1 hypothetical protein cce_0205 [Crocosphaera subtropica ATCC 51142]